MSLYSAIGLCVLSFLCVAICIAAFVAQQAKQESEHFVE